MELKTLRRMDNVRRVDDCGYRAANGKGEDPALILSKELLAKIRKWLETRKELRAVFKGAFKNQMAFHRWRMERYPHPRSDFRFFHLCTPEQFCPVNVNSFYWIPKDLVDFFTMIGKQPSDGCEYHGTVKSKNGESFYATISYLKTRSHLGTMSTELGAHYLWQEAKLKALRDLHRRYRHEVHECVAVWIESWIITFENDIYHKRPTLFNQNNQQGNDSNESI